MSATHSHPSDLIVTPCHGGHTPLSQDLLRTQSKLIAGFPLAAYCCDVNDMVICYNQACSLLWGRDLSRRQARGVKPSDFLLDSNGDQLESDQLPSSIALMKEPCLDGMDILIKQARDVPRRALIYSRLAHNEGGDMVGVVCALIDPANPSQVQAASKAATRPADEFMRVLAAEAERLVGDRSTSPISNFSYM